MLLCCLCIALAAGFIAIPVCATIYLSKRGVKFAKPLLLGTVTMTAGYLGSSLLLFGVDAIVTLLGGRSFIEDAEVIFYLGMAMGVTLAVIMTIVLAKPLKENRSAEETLIYGLGLALPMLVYRAFGVIFANVTLIDSGASYAVAAAMLGQSMFALATSFAETLCVVMLAYFINERKLWLGLAIALVSEVAINAAGSLNEAFGVPYIWYPIITFIVCMALAVFDVGVWKKFPPLKRDVKVRRGAKDIQWPDPGEDGR